GDALPEPDPALRVVGDGGVAPKGKEPPVEEGDAMPEPDPASCVVGDGGEPCSSSEEGESSEEEEKGGKSSEGDIAADNASDDIEITETFDEVEFGDGDESHQIYSNMSGVIITWNTRAEDTFKVFREKIAGMFGVDPQYFYIAHYAKVHQRRVPRQGLAPRRMDQ
ncbi:MAG: hypothetical protein ACKPKO_14660, partial [Candidatus Fonsibacter sp.]